MSAPKVRSAGRSIGPASISASRALSAVSASCSVSHALDTFRSRSPSAR